MDKNLERFSNDQLSHYERIAIEQTKQIRAKQKLEKSIASHAYKIECLKHSKRINEIALFSLSACITILISSLFIYFLTCL